MDLLNSIFHFFTDKTKKLPHKVILFLIAVILVILLDNLLSFSFSYNNGNKIEQIEGINKIIKDTTLSDAEKKKLFILRENIVNHLTWKDKAFDFLTSIEFKNDIESEKPIIKPIGKPATKPIIASIKLKTRDYFWHFISSSWLFIVLMVILPFIGLLDKKTKFWESIGIIIIVEPFLYGICWVYAKMFSFIPIILDNPIYNYILNAALCLTSILVFSLLKKKTK
ncbi:hypothetical protein SAMN02745938_1057 [Flavobacterium psychrophilum DSM 3660]|uniref:hypothetical protein n=1 Tax=Flavobacterium psychrophilum TaxID=96345 RepID=UPI0004F63B7A|nr:hypothetical protein [Flavobacterium psychrophilum]AIN75086.1 hypothetical protein FPG3_03365 [Flavobacterium psychrophilum FPG3]EKT2071701.1 hypothetical protein [Flavobacterium psychrophilum]EKT4491222.1 hypothetical protein [Flavobacterium psychrophilum]MBF2045450.1 hypothetical protein [Flavobacterium psychrophilum]OXB10554.1 hypothetical protein B0A57_09030 [Flavobacterium psychrophilum DSM 3660 = ATCC 49418]